MLEREAKMEAKAVAEKVELRQEIQRHMEKMREEMKPVEAISAQRLAALRTRIERSGPGRPAHRAPLALPTVDPFSMALFVWACKALLNRQKRRFSRRAVSTW